MNKLLLLLFIGTIASAEIITLDHISVEESEINTPSYEISESLVQETRSITLTDKLEQDVSFNSTAIGNGNKGLSFRGLDFKATEYIEDGIPLYKSTGGLIDTNLNMTDANILINDGSGVSSTGVAAMGGEVEISSSVPKEELEIKLGTTLSTNDEFYYTSLGSMIDNFYIQADASYYHRSNWKLSDNYSPTLTQKKGDRVNSDKEQKNFSLKAGTFINDNLHVAAKVAVSKAEYGLEPNIYAGNLGFSFFNYTRIDPKELDSYYLFVDYDYGDFEYSLRVYYDEYKDKYTVYDDVSYTNNFPVVTYDDSRIGEIFKATRNKGSSKTSFIFLNERNEHIRLGGGMADAKTQLDTYKPSLLHVEQFNENIKLEAGVSYTLMREHEASSESLQAMDDKTVLDAQMKVIYHKNQETIYLSAARKSRMPAMAEMFTFFSWETPDPNLKPERSWQYSAGYKHKIDKDSTINMDIYYYDIQDLIVESNSGFINKDSAEHYGAELRVDTKKLDNNNIRISYAYAHTQDNDGYDLALVPKHKLSIQDTINITNKINVFLSYKYVGSQYSYNFPSDLNNLHKLDDYNLLNAQISYSFKDELSARIGIKNITDENYQWQYGFPAEGRSFYLSLELKL